jgi:putative hydrolase of the HAD superfamily
MTTPRCVIFDLGNVIALFDKEPVWVGLAELTESRISAAQARDRIVESGLERQFDRGQIDVGTFLTRICAELGLAHVQKPRIAALWQNVFQRNEPVIKVLARLRAQGPHRLLLASNTNALHFERIGSDFHDVLALFDEMILSFQIGHIKPEREFFERCVKAAQCHPTQCVYVDDLPPFCEAARAGFGIHPVCYGPGVDLDRLLENMGL